MRKLAVSVFIGLISLFVLVPVLSSEEHDMTDRLYLVPVERVGSPPNYDASGPKYFAWRYDPDPPGITVAGTLGYQFYGFHPWVLVVAGGISDVDHNFLSTQSDVYVYPEITPGPEAGNFRIAESSNEIWLSKEDRNGVSTQPFFNSLTDISVITFTSELDSDFIEYEVFAKQENIGRDYYSILARESARAGGFADAENVSVDGVPLRFDAATRLMPNLDQSIPGNDPIDTFYEDINIPTDWLGPANTYREFLRQTMGMFVFHNRYEFKSDGRSLFENADLSTRFRDLTAQEQVWFNETVLSFGYDPSFININNTLRQLLKQAGDLFASWRFELGGIAL
jgi:hypothetical protein